MVEESKADTAETPAAEPHSKKMKLSPFDWFLHSAGSQSCSTTVRGSNVDVPLTERLLDEIRAYEQIPMPNVASFDPLSGGVSSTYNIPYCLMLHAEYWSFLPHHRGVKGTVVLSVQDISLQDSTTCCSWKLCKLFQWSLRDTRTNSVPKQHMNCSRICSCITQGLDC